MLASIHFADVFCFAFLTPNHVELLSDRIHQSRTNAKACDQEETICSFLPCCNRGCH